MSGILDSDILIEVLRARKPEVVQMWSQTVSLADRCSTRQ